MNEVPKKREARAVTRATLTTDTDNPNNSTPARDMQTPRNTLQPGVLYSYADALAFCSLLKIERGVV